MYRVVHTHVPLSWHMYGDQWTVCGSHSVHLSCPRIHTWVIRRPDNVFLYLLRHFAGCP